MDELSVSEILTGLVTKEYQEHRLALLQHLTNCFAENPTVASGLELKSVFKTLLVLLTTTLGTDDDKRSQINTSVTALVNSTTSEENIQTFLEVLSETMDKELYSDKFRRCISNYLDHNPQLEDESSKGKDDDYWVSNDEWQHMGNLLCNLAQLEDGRRIVLQQSTGYMERLVVQIRSNNPTRRRGAVGTIRSCLFDESVHWWMLYEIRVLTPLLLPLVGNNPFTEKEREGMEPILWMKSEDVDKMMEPELDIMKMLLECIILLCQKRGMREELRKRKVYPVVKNLDLKVEDEGISTAIHEIVNFLMGDEDPSTPIETYDEYLQNRRK